MNTPIIFNPEIRLTEHFKLGEFTKSITEPAPTATSARAATGRSMAVACASGTS